MVFEAPEGPDGDGRLTQVGCIRDGIGRVRGRAREQASNIVQGSLLSQCCRSKLAISLARNVSKTNVVVILCTKGFSFPGLRGAEMSASMDSVIVAVKRQVCLSLGNTLNK